MLFRKMFRALALPMALVMFLVSGPLTAVQAGMVATDRVMQEEAVAADRAKIAGFLAREDVRAEMVALGLDPGEAAARVQALSDAEIARIAGTLGDDPAGQALGAIIGAAVLIFIVLLITDILCLTDVFPFTRCARN